MSINSIKEREEEHQRALQHKKEKEIELERERKEKEAQLQVLRESIGGAEVEINIPMADQEVILVNETNRKIAFGMKIFDFKDIINYEVKDNSQIITQTSTSHSSATTSTNTGNMLGRAVVGGLIGGGVGAIIGSATASTTTSYGPDYSYSKNDVIHNFYITVFLNRLTDPTIEISLKQDERTVQNIAGILAFIVNHNRQENASLERSETKSTSLSDELIKLAELRDKGILTEEEFQQQKSKLLNKN